MKLELQDYKLKKIRSYIVRGAKLQVYIYILISVNIELPILFNLFFQIFSSTTECASYSVLEILINSWPSNIFAAARIRHVLLIKLNIDSNVLLLGHLPVVNFVLSKYVQQVNGSNSFPLPQSNTPRCICIVCIREKNMSATIELNYLDCSHAKVFL